MKSEGSRDVMVVPILSQMKSKHFHWDPIPAFAWGDLETLKKH